ncbi:Alpha/Beta hydrolase protein [Cladorrhinum samala]|uniref:Alpha/Beta hydrolase protein n=1 Tax=Cladorrhinum samala TaxID=585594 RepID=A0AAV9HHQ0_9PEZI|nr:Alpha/Beta hydrolase protein [Cladorrhinum samala]
MDGLGELGGDKGGGGWWRTRMGKNAPTLSPLPLSRLDCQLLEELSAESHWNVHDSSDSDDSIELEKEASSRLGGLLSAYSESDSGESAYTTETISTAPEMAPELDNTRDSYEGPLRAHLKQQPLETDDDDYRAMSMDFEVPLDYGDPYGERITIHAELIYAPKDKDSKQWKRREWKEICLERKFLVYLCGGPGDANPRDRIPNFNELALKKGYSILYPDYRGTGRSTPVNETSLKARFENEENAEDKLADYLSLFRQDNIVRDLEAIRQCLEDTLSNDQDIKFTLHGQSFGGWIALTYLSFLGGQALEKVFLTAGLAPINKTPDSIYKALYERAVTANEKYYELFPQDAALVKEIYTALRGKNIEIPLNDEGPSGRVLSAQTFLTLGRKFIAGSSGMNAVHEFVVALSGHLKANPGGASIPDGLVKKFAELEGFKLHARPLYGVLHESIYCAKNDVTSNWAAARIGKGTGGFEWLDKNNAPEDMPERIYFSGEMVYPFMMRSIRSKLLQDAGEAFARRINWPRLYDPEQLRKNTVPVKAMVFPDDLAVDYEASIETAKLMNDCSVVEAEDGWEHGSLRSRTEDVFNRLYGSENDWKEPAALGG